VLQVTLSVLNSYYIIRLTNLYRMSKNKIQSIHRRNLVLVPFLSGTVALFLLFNWHKLHILWVAALIISILPDLSQASYKFFYSNDKIRLNRLILTIYFMILLIICTYVPWSIAVSNNGYSGRLLLTYSLFWKETYPMVIDFKRLTIEICILSALTGLALTLSWKTGQENKL